MASNIDITDYSSFWNFVIHREVDNAAIVEACPQVVFCTLGHIDGKNFAIKVSIVFDIDSIGLKASTTINGARTKPQNAHWDRHDEPLIDVTFKCGVMIERYLLSKAKDL